MRLIMAMVASAAAARADLPRREVAVALAGTVNWELQPIGHHGRADGQDIAVAPTARRP